MTSVAEVRLWNRTIGAVSLEDGYDEAAFQYAPGFAVSAIELSPITMPLSNRIYTFPALARDTFHGLPGLLADSLPDRFGNQLIDAWLATQGRPVGSLNAIERLCYTGARGMGALEFRPAAGPRPTSQGRIDVARLVELASKILSHRGQLAGLLTEEQRSGTLADILRIGTSAGGARAKAVISWNPRTQEIRSGQIDATRGFESWLIKFDGVSGNKDKELEDPKGYGAIEYAYSLMARAAGLEMSACRLMEEGGRRHFMTRRFDRDDEGGKLHMQSLAALAHLDFNAAGAHSYEQAYATIRRLGLGMDAIEQQFRRMIFNVVGRNQDDHVKNIAFLMDKAGAWRLSPAFDVTYSYNPSGDWTARHQMSINGARDAFTRADFRACAKTAQLQRGRSDALLDEVIQAVGRWDEFAAEAGVAPARAHAVATTHRLAWGAR
ncbi:MAG: type II toxin-antitoxin system HipA family toxin [Planctomycetota bacterium]|nr:MAG: type II toxin-antitoxin system HipA family toxin [Planctomycetota bacterium]